MPDFFPDIHEYLESTETSRSVTTKNLEPLVYKVRASTGLSYDVSKAIVRHFFQEIMNGMLRGDVVMIRGLGKFYVSSPLHGNKELIFPKFEAYKKLMSKLND